MTDHATPFSLPNNRYKDVTDRTSEIEVVDRGELHEAVRQVKSAALDAARRIESDNKDGPMTYDEYIPPGTVDRLHAAVDRYCEPSVRSAGQMIDNLMDAREALSYSPNDMTIVKDVTEDWVGDARDSFYTNFLVPFPGAVTAQAQVIDELYYSLSAYRTMILQSRVDLKRTLEKAKESLDAYDGWNDINFEFVTGLVTTLVGLFTPLPDEGIGLALIGKGLAGADAGAKINGKVEAEGIDSIINATLDLIRDHEQKMADIEDNMSELLQKSISKVDGLLRSHDPRKKTLLLPNEILDAGPQILDDDVANDAPEFRPPGS